MVMFELNTLKRNLISLICSVINNRWKYKNDRFGITTSSLLLLFNWIMTTISGRRNSPLTLTFCFIIKKLYVFLYAKLTCVFSFFFCQLFSVIFLSLFDIVFLKEFNNEKSLVCQRQKR